MARNVISAKLDITFKKIFTENEDMLHSFVASMLDIPQESISEIKITNTELPPETLAGKFSRLDLEPIHIKIASKIIAKVRFPKYRTSSLS